MTIEAREALADNIGAFIAGIAEGCTNAEALRAIMVSVDHYVSLAAAPSPPPSGRKVTDLIRAELADVFDRLDKSDAAWRKTYGATSDAGGTITVAITTIRRINAALAVQDGPTPPNVTGGATPKPERSGPLGGPPGPSEGVRIDPSPMRSGPNVKHSLERTSPKGGTFIGTCVLCGATGLPLSAAFLDCPNPRGVTVDEALVEAVAGPTLPDDVRETLEMFRKNWDKRGADLLEAALIAATERADEAKRIAARLNSGAELQAIMRAHNATVAERDAAIERYEKAEASSHEDDAS